ncbi:glycosyltransferase family 8 protein [Carboxylicivirga sp. M1479]|uniref:glycosyltransferase family 8 protein n=1 Tax=Carboxylicivirga sp. M1479 TaxID=2594476 RepID=UPI001177D974|nr:glycosyltransferase family 8 protein [Carboxylicivirga sp. M1479]TRX72633.1 glycosyltransferase family 8 protein [Carboxylicivirga sp. M1479]
MTIPIVISFNDNFTIPAGVCLTSLCINANPETIYDVFVLHSSSRLSNENKELIKKLEEQYENISIKFIDVKNEFKESYEVRNVTIESYYRLLIPNIFKDKKKVIYLDIDTIVKIDLSKLYNTDLKENCLAGVPEFVEKAEVFQQKHIISLSLSPKDYINAGILVFNLKKIRAEINIFNKKVSDLSKLKLMYQDQDILNIIFKDDIQHLEHKYNYSYQKLIDGLVCDAPAIIHYTMDKPWNTPRPFGDVWWHYYKKSNFYKREYYLNYQAEAFKDIGSHLKLGQLLKKLGLYHIITLKNYFIFLFKSHKLK